MLQRRAFQAVAWYLRQTHRYGIEHPKTVEKAYGLDKKNENAFLADAIAKKVQNDKMPFKSLQNGEKPTVGYHYVKFHMVLNVMTKDLRCKARLVTSNHMTDSPAVITYASVLSRDMDHISMTNEALNELEGKIISWMPIFMLC